MKICVHRGTREIGGTCIELEAEGSRIALDVGLPLDAPDEGHGSLLPAVAGFREPDDSLLGVVISHPHQDHYGLARHIRPGVPVYIGQDAHNVMKAASAYVPNGHAFDNPRFIAHRKPLEIGPVPHHALSRRSQRIRRLCASGGGGGETGVLLGRLPRARPEGRLFEAMIEHPPRDIDVLLMEGTTIGRTGTDEGFATEADLEEEFVRAFRETEGFHLVWASAQNIDRMVTIFRAARRTGRVLLIDLYTAVVLEATGRDTIPQSDWPDVKLYIPHAQRVTIKRKGLFGDLTGHSANRIYPGHLPGLKDRAVMLFRPMMTRDCGMTAVLDGARLSYSMWQGYLKEESTAKVREWLEEREIPLEVIHTSGHASVADLRRFAAALAPRKLVPIHSFETARFGEFFDHVVQREDGLWWDV